MRQVTERLGTFGWRLERNNTLALATIGVIALALGIALSALGRSSLSALLAVPAALAILLLICLRQYLLLAALVVFVAIFIDFYQFVGLPLHEPVAALLLAFVVLAILFFTQSERTPWISLRHLIPWAALLVLAALAIPRGGSLSQTVSYYVTIFGIAIVVYCLGTQVSRSYRDLQFLLLLLILLASFIALHTLIQGVTGKFLFATAAQSDYLSSVSGFQLAGSSASRAGSFLLNPDWNGLFLAVSLFLAAGMLFADAASRVVRGAAAIACALILLALLFTFTTASWLAAGAGFVIFVSVFLPKKYRLRTLVVAGAGLLIGVIIFARESRLLLQHATATGEYTLRLGAWETALRIILTHPLTGIGMAYTLYLDRAEAYRSPLQTQQLAHPHNSYLELAAFAGIPVLAAFLLLLFLAFRTAWRTYHATDARYQPLIGGVITGLIVLSVNSLFINGWTLPPFACLGWLLMGAITSRALLASREASSSAAFGTPVESTANSVSLATPPMTRAKAQTEPHSVE
jgi:O-antigen ligase